MILPVPVTSERKGPNGELLASTVRFSVMDAGPREGSFLRALLLTVWLLATLIGGLMAFMFVVMLPDNAEPGTGWAGLIFVAPQAVLWMLHTAGVFRLRPPMRSDVSIVLDFENDALLVHGGEESANHPRGRVCDLSQVSSFRASSPEDGELCHYRRRAEIAARKRRIETRQDPTKMPSQPDTYYEHCTCLSILTRYDEQRFLATHYERTDDPNPPLRQVQRALSEALREGRKEVEGAPTLQKPQWEPVE